MSIAHRIGELYAAKMNAVLDRVSDPRELADYTYTQLRDLLAEVHRSMARVAAGREHAELRVNELQHAADRMGEQSERAVQAGREDLARQALARRSAILAEVSTLREQHDALLAEERKLSAPSGGCGPRSRSSAPGRKRSRPLIRRRGPGRSSPRPSPGSPVR